MALVTLNKLGKSYDPLDIFSDLSLNIPHGARIAIVGANGIGKTTLLKIIANLEPPSSGSVHRARGLTIGYLPQESQLKSSNTLWESCLQPFESIRAMQAELTRLEAQLSSASETETLLDRYGKIQARFESLGGYTYETTIRIVLNGLGFKEAEYTMPLNHLSGGQRTRAILARLLLEKPALLILDEPTNHLDIDAVEWLESYLRDWEGAALIVSHDRYFLDKVCNRIWEMRGGSIEQYHGNYSHYLQQREERWHRREKSFTAEKERLEKEWAYIKRNIAGQNVSQAKGRLRRLSRQIQAIEQLGLEAIEGKKWAEISREVNTSTSVMSVDEAHRRIQALHNPLERPRRLKIHLKTAKRSGNIILRTENLLVGYPGNPLFTAPALELRRQDCATLIGPNGAGKTTFLKTILGQLEPLRGKVTLGASLDIGYFAQAHEGLNPRHTLIEEIESAAPGLRIAEIRSYLARYLFQKDDVYKKVSMLSGGEQGRLALAKLALSKANLLLLDEPTNHLDIPSQEVLQNVLADFQGTIILVTHDRYLIDALGTQIWEIDKKGQQLIVFKGSYSAYQASKSTAPETKSSPVPAVNSGKQRLQQTRASKNRIQAEERRNKKRINEIEEEITRLETRMDTLSTRLANPPNDPARIQELGRQYVENETRLNELLEEWENLHKRQEHMETQKI